MDLGFLGGFEYRDESLRQLPFKVVAAYDNDARCVTTYRKNLGDHAFLEDLATIDMGRVPAADVLIGGFPCQDFSSCGPKRGLDTARGKLYLTLIQYMQEHRPAVVVAENVVHLARMRGGEVLKVIMEDLRATGYRFETWNLFAPDYGVPQTRARLFLVGVRPDLEGAPEMPEPTHAEAHRSIDWALSDLEDVLDESVPNQSQYFKANRAKNGHGQGDETNLAGQPSYTIRANAKSRIQFHYRLPRRLTIRECARLQTFPDTFVFPFEPTRNIRQVGNAVPPLLAFHVANSVATFLKKALPREARMPE